MPRDETRELRCQREGSHVDRRASVGVDASSNAGENVGKGRWTRAKLITRSRLEGTRVLSEALAGLERFTPRDA